MSDKHMKKILNLTSNQGNNAKIMFRYNFIPKGEQNVENSTVIKD